MALSRPEQPLGYLQAFLRRPRAAQATVLFFGSLIFWSAPLCYTGVVSFPVFVCCLALGNVVFACGLMFDALLITETQEQADKAPPAVAAVLLARVNWRWHAFYALVFATLLCIPGTVLFIRAWQAGASPQQLPAARGNSAASKVFRGDVYFAVSTVLFFLAYLAQAVDASLTMHDVAVLMGLPPPGFDETHQILALIGLGLGLLSFGLSFQVLTSFGARAILAADAVVGLFCGVALLSLTVGTGWFLATQLREFRDELRAKKGADETAPLLSPAEAKAA